MTETDATLLFDQTNKLLQQGQLSDAANALKAAISARPHYPEAYFNLGRVLRITSDLGEAAVAFEKAVEQAPEDVEARYELANTYRDILRLEDAEREMRATISLQPDRAISYSALGIILLEAGRTVDAVTAFADAMGKDPSRTNAATNWVNTQQYMPGVTEENLAESHAFWSSLHAPETAPSYFANSLTMDRPLKVGFVSPDLGVHPVGLLSVRLFENLNHSEICPFVFSTKPQIYDDHISKRIAEVTNWATVFGISDDDLAALIVRSKIDILVDLSGHTANHRLKMFARRAAPIQVSWLGYTGTTGLAEMDYVLANDQLAPPGTETNYTERIIRLPRWHACFDPLPKAPSVGPLPAMQNGFITFGCFNNPTKLSDQVIASFAKILSRVPGSRLKLQYKSMTDSGLQKRLRAILEGHGISKERVDIAGQSMHREFLASYNDVDIALDTFPYSGCMTTCEASWMGCPVITFPGATFAGRQATSFLAAAGLDVLIARDQAHYEDLAVELAGDHDGLEVLRAGLRARLSASSVCNGAGFAKDFTTAMRQVWLERCTKMVP